MKKYAFILVFCAVFLNACSTPQYETRYQFNPPANKAGLACLKTCQSKLNQCQQQCSGYNQQCAAKASQQAKAEMPGRFAAYQEALALWERDWERYERDRRFNSFRLRHAYLGYGYSHYKHKHKGRHHRHYPHFGASFYLDEPIHPGRPPRPPSLQRVVADIRKQNCSSDCQCTQNHHQCYQSCGGIIRPYKVCTRNCG